MFLTLKKIVVLLVFVFLQEYVLASRREFPTCRSRDSCIRLTNCVSYMNLIKSLKKPLSRASVLFLRKQECGFDGMYPMVCCFPSNTRRAQGNRINFWNDREISTKTPTYYVSYNPETEPEETYQPLKKPNFTPSDLSDYRSLKDQDQSLPVPVQISIDQDESVDTSTIKSTTEMVKTTTRLFRRKVKNSYMNQATTDQSVPVVSAEAKNKRAEELKKKMEAINNAFMYSTMDYFFVRRMDDENRKNDG